MRRAATTIIVATLFTLYVVPVSAAPAEDVDRPEQPAAPDGPRVAPAAKTKFESFVEESGRVVIETSYRVGGINPHVRDQGPGEVQGPAQLLYDVEFVAAVAHETGRPGQGVKGMRVTIHAGRGFICYLDPEHIDQLGRGVDRLTAALKQWEQAAADGRGGGLSVLRLTVGDLRIQFSRLPGLEGEVSTIDFRSQPGSGRPILRAHLQQIKQLAEACRKVLSADDPAAAARELNEGDAGDEDGQPVPDGDPSPGESGTEDESKEAAPE